MTTTDVADAFQPGEWEFTPEVVAQFDNHVRQSVPFYDVIQDQIATLSDWLAPADSTVVDLGCSTGETFRRLRERHPARHHHLVGYDESGDMLKAASQKVDGSLELHERDVLQGLCHHEASLTVCAFTLQFLDPMDREAVLVDARERTLHDGAILVAEKVRVRDERWAEIAAELSWDYKAEQGIPSESIRSKARALRGVLRPLTVEDNLRLLEGAGWRSATCLFRWNQWCLFGAFAS